VNSRYISKGANYEKMLALLNEQGIADVQTTEDLELKNALGNTMYNSLKNKYAKTKNYLHVSDVKNITTLDAERTDLVSITNVIKYMPKLTTIYLRYNDIRDVDITESTIGLCA
jgi:Leucine-rich repeat (LRR) protein